MNKIIDRLFVGSYDDGVITGAGVNPNQITLILDVCELAYQTTPPIEFVHIPFADGQAVPAVAFGQCMKVLHRAYRQDRVILLHCYVGRSRAPSICAAFLVQHGFVADFDTALSFVIARRPQASPDPAIINSIKDHILWREDGRVASTP